MITVVIPYYQKKTGILARALASIKLQEPCGMPVHVVVVDDASPVPAKGEVDSLGNLPFSIEVICQENSGPGGARNTGLDHAPKGTRYIAFLDSDDEWDSSHLQRAVAALKAGYSLYFSNHYHLGQSIGAFERAGRLDLAKHVELVDVGTGIYAYQGDMLDQIIRGNIIGTSTVVYDFQRCPEKRFRIEFANAGEDYLFWMELVSNGVKTAFSVQCEARYGHGVNIYSGSGWGTEQHLLRIHNELKYRKTTANLFSLTSDQQAHLKRCIEELRASFARDLLHRLAHRKGLAVRYT
ncbi:MAG: glycosyltransferase family 2 protein [Betaproteobacteria bacterium]|nr:glycosyltransferase family 2 protein [Betaproteobacteria bacterium]